MLATAKLTYIKSVQDWPEKMTLLVVINLPVVMKGNSMSN